MAVIYVFFCVPICVNNVRAAGRGGGEMWQEEVWEACARRRELISQRRNAAGSCFSRNMITFAHIPARPTPPDARAHTHSRHPAATTATTSTTTTTSPARRDDKQNKQPHTRIHTQAANIYPCETYVYGAYLHCMCVHFVCAQAT